MKPEKEVQTTLTIQNSKFIGILLPFRGDVKHELSKIKETYKKATHYCYAYRMENEVGTHDDGEPSKTAGLPILNMLEKYKIKGALLVVVRYFGGIKLGTGGLIRAYQQIAEKTIQEATLLPLKEGYEVLFEVSYANLEQVTYLLKDSIILSKQFDEKITIQAKIVEEIKEPLTQMVEILSMKKCSF